MLITKVLKKTELEAPIVKDFVSSLNLVEKSLIKETLKLKDTSNLSFSFKATLNNISKIVIIFVLLKL